MTSHPPVLHFFVHRAFICAAVNLDAFYIFLIACGTVHKSRPYCLFILNHCQIGKVLSRILLRYEQTTYQSNSFQWGNVVKRHSPDTLKRAAKQTWFHSSTLHFQIARPWRQIFQSNSPLSGGQVWSNTPYLLCLSPPPPPPPWAKQWYIVGALCGVPLIIIQFKKLITAKCLNRKSRHSFLKLTSEIHISQNFKRHYQTLVFASRWLIS